MVYIQSACCEESFIDFFEFSDCLCLLLVHLVVDFFYLLEVKQTLLCLPSLRIRVAIAFMLWVFDWDPKISNLNYLL